MLLTVDKVCDGVILNNKKSNHMYQVSKNYAALAGSSDIN